MFEEKQNSIKASELKTYLDSLEREKEREKSKEIKEYKLECNIRQTKIRKREIVKIERAIDKEYTIKFKVSDEILDLLEEIEEIPRDIEKLKVTEYMLYRVDLRKAEKIVNKVYSKLQKRFEDINKQILNRISEFSVFKNVSNIDYTEYYPQEDNLAKSKEQYKLQYTEEERKQLIKKELDMIEQLKEFNSLPIPHEILKNSDRDIQSKMQRFNNIRQKRIRILDTMQNDYEKLLDPKEILCLIDDATQNIKGVEDILTRTEYNSVKGALHKKIRKIKRSTKDIQSIIDTKEQKAGISNFNVQQARYVRMENLRNIIQEAITLIRDNPIEQSEEQLEKLKIAYQREKQFASVIEKLNDGNDNNDMEIRAYEEQINNLQYKLLNSKRIVSEQQERIKQAKKELLVLWKMEINSAVDKKKEGFNLLGAPNQKEETRKKNSREKQRSIY